VGLEPGFVHFFVEDFLPLSNGSSLPTLLSTCSNGGNTMLFTLPMICLYDNQKFYCSLNSSGKGIIGAQAMVHFVL
jgi:hypothetical protein